MAELNEGQHPCPEA